MNKKDQTLIWEAFTNRVSYSGVVLDEESRNKLLSSPEIQEHLSPDMDIICHHMTINMGPLKERERLGQTEQLRATHVGTIDGGITAVRVIGNSTNSVPHITMGVNRGAGFKPKHSNDIKQWKELINPIDIKGVVQEIS